VLFMDIVSYSKMPMDHQKAVLGTLQSVVCAAPEFLQAQASQEMIRLPTGDGMALVFFGDAEAAARCALEITKALESHPEISLRMGLHSGRIYRVADINANENVAGGGINIAQRVMDCGDAGHILASQSVADVLGHLSSWKDYLHDIGEAEVKHGVRVHLYNLFTNEVGNAELPHKLQTAQRRLTAMRSKARSKKLALGMVAAGALTTLAIGGFLYPRHAHALTDKDTIVIADFTNTTGDTVFDDTLKQALAVDLGQWPFLNILSEDKARQTLRQMTRSPGERLTQDLAREVCQRAGSKAYREARSDLRCMARATSCLPVPVSPVMRTVESLGATLEMRERTLFKAGDVPTISSNIEALSIPSRRATFSLRSLSSARLRSSTSVKATYQRVICPSSSCNGL